MAGLFSGGMRFGYTPVRPQLTGTSPQGPDEARTRMGERLAGYVKEGMDKALGLDPKWETHKAMEAVGQELSASGVDMADPDQAYPAAIKLLNARGQTAAALALLKEYNEYKLKTDDNAVDREKIAADKEKGKDDFLSKLNPKDYTPESWEKFSFAVENGAQPYKAAQALRRTPEANWKEVETEEGVYLVPNNIDLTNLSEEQVKALLRRVGKPVQKGTNIHNNIPPNHKEADLYFKWKDKFTGDLNVKAYQETGRLGDNARALLNAAENTKNPRDNQVAIEMAKQAVASLGKDRERAASEMKMIRDRRDIPGWLKQKLVALINGDEIEVVFNELNQIVDYVQSRAQEGYEKERNDYLEGYKTLLGKEYKNDPKVDEFLFPRWSYGKPKREAASSGAVFSDPEKQKRYEEYKKARGEN